MFGTETRAAISVIKNPFLVPQGRIEQSMTPETRDRWRKLLDQVGKEFFFARKGYPREIIPLIEDYNPL